MNYDEVAMFTFDCYSEEGVMHHEHIESLMVDNFTLKCGSFGQPPPFHYRPLTAFVVAPLAPKT